MKTQPQKKTTKNNLPQTPVFFVDIFRTSTSQQKATKPTITHEKLGNLRLLHPLRPNMNGLLLTTLTTLLNLTHLAERFFPWKKTPHLQELKCFILHGARQGTERDDHRDEHLACVYIYIYM